MQIYVVAIGKELSGGYKSLAAEYEKRLGSDVSVSWQLIPSASSHDLELCRNQESTAILQSLKQSDTVILLDERGNQESNAQFAERFDKLRGRHGRLVFVIGGAFGVNEELRSRADFVWSLSSLVFPHQLVRIMLLEQLYRTHMVLKNHPYHHN